MTIVKMPQLGESVTEGTIIQWFKQPGDPVKLDEPPEESLFDRIMHGVMSKLRMPVRMPTLVGQH